MSVFTSSLTAVNATEVETVSSNMDFSSCRLMVGTKDTELLADNENILSNYNGVYLLQYDTEEQTKDAYYTLIDKADFVNIDSNSFSVATESIENSEIGKMSKAVNPLKELSESNTADVVEDNVIAVIDTGSFEHPNVIERVSMLGDSVEDDNGHGNVMISSILSQNEEAKIISIKALDSKGNGSISSVYASLQYAIEKNVDLINMSFVGIANEDTTAIEGLINEAIQKGITVVGAAGNSNIDASYFIPGIVKDAYIIGSADMNGNRLSSSNYGENVDYNVVANSTSEASALFTGYISKNKEVLPTDINNGFIYSTDYVYVEDVTEVPTEVPTIEPTEVSTDAPTEANTEPVEDVKPEDSDYIKEVEDLPVDTSKKVLVKYLFVDEDQIGDYNTIDQVMYYNTSAVLYQLETFVDVHKASDGTYKVVTDAPFVNGSATSGVIDVAYARGNDTGNSVSKGISFDYDNYIATISEDVLSTISKDDFANLQIQIMVTATLESTTSIKARVEDSSGKVLGNSNIVSKPFETLFLSINTEDNLSKDDLSIYLNNSTVALDSNDYSIEDNVVYLSNNVGSVKNVKIVLKGNHKGTFNISILDGYKGQNATKIGWLKKDTDVSFLKVGSTANTTVRVGHSGFGYTNDSNPIIGGDTPAVNVPGLNGQGFTLANIGIANSMTFDGKKVNFQFYRDGVSSYGTWSDGYNHSVPGTCHHINAGYKSEQYKAAKVKILQITKDSSNSRITYITFQLITNTGFSGTGTSGVSQAIGGLYVVGVEQSPIKLQLWKSSDNTDAKYTDMSGAKFLIYTDKNCTVPYKVNGVQASITTDSSGYGKYGSSSDTNNDSDDAQYDMFYKKNAGVNVVKGTYYAKESVAPNGFKLSTTVYVFKDTGKKASNGASIYRAKTLTADNSTPKNTPFVRLQLLKRSADTTITNNNGCYSLEGARYNIYTDLACTKPYKTSSGANAYMVTDADGYAKLGTAQTATNNDSKDSGTKAYNKNSGGSIELTKGLKLYAKEDPRYTPKGYECDSTVYTFMDSGRVASDGRRIFRAYKGSVADNNQPKDVPKTDPMNLGIRKRDAVTGETTGLGGAIFEVTYYADHIDADVNVTSLSSVSSLNTSTKKRTWYIETDSNGLGLFHEDYITSNPSYSSDDFYRSNSSVSFITIPLGTIVIKEVKAPEGYELNNTLFVRRVTEEGIDSNVRITVDVDETKSANIDTVAIDNSTRSHKAYINASSTITDTITYSGLNPNETYTMRGYVVNQSTGAKLSTEVSKSFTASADGNGTVRLTHTFSSLTLENKKAVAFAFVYDASGKLVVSHNDRNDADQSVLYLAGKSMVTNAYDGYFPDSEKAYFDASAGNAVICDEVYMTGLTKGNTYSLYTEVYEIIDGVVQDEPVDLIKGAGVKVKGFTTTFTTEGTGGTTSYNLEVSASIKIPTETDRDHTYVVYETLKDSRGNVVIEHKDPTDKDQQVTYMFSDIDTKAYFANNQKLAYDGERRIVDKVTLTNLIPGATYYYTPYIVDKAENSVISVADVYFNNRKVLSDTYDGRYDIDASQSIPFVATSDVRTLTVIYDLSDYVNMGNSLLNKEFVAYGALNVIDGVDLFTTIAWHEDINDADQTVKIIEKPMVRTVATSTFTGSHWTYATEELEVVDKVSFTNLIPNLSYTIKGKVVDKSDTSVTLAEASKTFIAQSSNSTETMSFIFDASDYAGKEVVVYEYLYYNGMLLSSHADKNDTSQTIIIVKPTIETKASGTDSPAKETLFTDNITMTGLLPGKYYTIEGQLIDKETAEPITLISATSESGTVTLSDDNLTANIVFVAQAETQVVAVDYVFDALPYAGKKVVAFETLNYNYTTIAQHTDIEDENQTIEYKNEGNLFLTKYDTFTNENMSGVVFNIYRVNDDGTETKLENCFSSENNEGNYLYTVGGAYTDLKVSSISTEEQELGTLLVQCLPGGNYRLVEKSTKEGYSIDIEEGIAFTISAGETSELTVGNSPKFASINLVKTDDNTNKDDIKYLEGVGFTLYSDSACSVEAVDFYGAKYGEVKTDDGGMLSFARLRYNTNGNTSYYLKETTVLEGYAPLGYIIRVNIDKNGTVTYYKVTGSSETLITDKITETMDVGGNTYSFDITRIINKRGTLILHKTDADGFSLTGSEWELHKVVDGVDTVVVLEDLGDGKYRCMDKTEGSTALLTSTLGTLNVANLPLGDYYLVEVKAPDGYMPYGEKIYFSLTADNDIANISSDVTVKDNKKLLPSTGGLGEQGIYLMGIAFFIISIIFTFCGVKFRNRKYN